MIRALRSLRVCVLVPLAALLFCAPLAAQRSTLRHFDVADGLPSTRVSAIAEDSAGFLWVTTLEGIARFDGTRFEVFGPHDGLPRSAPNEVREDRHGRLWVALNGAGIARLLDEQGALGKSTFQNYTLAAGQRENTVNAIYFDAQDRLWLGSEAGLARASLRENGSLEVEYLPDSVQCLNPEAACASGDGAIWFLGSQGLACVRDGVLTTWPLPEPTRHDDYLCLAAISPTELLIGDDSALWKFDVAGATWQRVPLELATNQGVRALLVDSRHDIWVCTTNGLIRLRGGEQMLYTTAQGLSDNSIRCAFEDRAGRLWFGTWFGGVVQFGRADMPSWTRSDEMPNPDVTAIKISSGGKIYASTINDGVFELDQRGAHRLGAELSPKFDRIWTRFLELPGPSWLVGIEEGMFVVPGAELDLTRARRLGAESGCEGLLPIAIGVGRKPGEVIVNDMSGRLMRGNFEADGSAHFVDILRSEGRAELLAKFKDSLRVSATAPDGTLWVASRRALARQKGEAFEFIETSAGLPTTEVRDLFFDRLGQLWVALRHDGVSRCDNPSASVTQWNRVDGLSEEKAFSIAQSRAGRVYVGTWSGVQELDSQGVLLRRFTSASGLVSNTVNALAVDAEDRVWVATSAGVTRLDTRGNSQASEPPASWISRVEVDGEPLAVPRRAARSFGPLKLAAGHDTLLVGFCAPWLESEEPLYFQLQLVGVDLDWSKPQTDQQVRFARLAPGDYRLLVRAVLGSSRLAGEPAMVEFSVPPPFWMRPWFLALAVLGVAGLLFAWHRVQLRQALALERVRSQIALDLHDELGADLTQVAILAELARRETHSSGGEALLKVAGLARDMRESLADIVWSVDPRRDKVGDLAVRLRQVGNQLVEAGGIEFALLVDSDRAIEALPIAPDERRGLYLIVKESLHNAVKHAEASRIDVALHVHGSQLSVSIQDDGRGFDPAAAHTGHGLRGLHSRAKALGAQLSIRSELGSGTSIQLALRLRGGPA